MTKIALIGYGKMGQMVKEAAHSLPVEIVAIIDPKQPDCASEITSDTLKDAKVCIEFSHPDVVLQNIEKVCLNKRNIVIGTTGWNEHLELVRQMVDKSGIGAVYGSNLSIGMNLFYEIVAKAAAVFSPYENYDCYGLELHHKQKADNPSGTAKELSRILQDALPLKTSVLYDKPVGKIGDHELHFASVRAGFIPGTHTIGFDSEADTIELTHRVRNRTGFAMGALKAAIWISGKHGLFTFQDFIRGN